MTLPRRCAGALLLLAAAVAQAFDVKSIGATPAILYDAPSERGAKLFIAPRGMPVEVVLSDGAWVKVRHKDGIIAYIKASDIWGI